MNDGEERRAEPEQRSKFEWRPEDITILTPAEAANAEAEYQELLAEIDEKTQSRPDDSR
jgi:hypothetical protein